MLRGDEVGTCYEVMRWVHVTSRRGGYMLLADEVGTCY